MMSSWCNYDNATVVLCHSNKQEHGKGMGLKADDRHAFFGCSGCHDFFDRRPGYEALKARLFKEAVERTHKRMVEKGLGDLLKK